MDLERFMERVNVGDAKLAEIVGRDRSTISRIRRRVVAPDAVTMLRLDRWATAAARWRRLKPRERLTWDHIEPAA